MKFGRGFRNLQISQWADAYLNYDGLKQLVKTHPSNHNSEYFKHALAEEVAELDIFVAKQHSLLNSWVEAVLSRFALSAASTLQVDHFAPVAPPELRDLGDCLNEILDFATQLDRFCKLNRDAVERLLEAPSLTAEGRESILSFDGPLYSRPWADATFHVHRLLDLVHRAAKVHDGTMETKSLLLEPVSPHVLGCTSHEVHHAILADDSAALMCVMESPVAYLENQAMLHSVLQVAIVYHSPRCIRSLLEEITVPLDAVPCGHQDVLQQLISQISRLKSCEAHSLPLISGMRVLEDTFRELSPYQHKMLLAKDWRGRYPLHYAAQYGLVDVCSQILKFMDPSAALESDSDGQTPLELAVRSGQLGVVRLLLELDTTRSMLSDKVAGALLTVAIRANFRGVAKCLAELGKGLNFQGKHGQAPLFIAARSGQVEVVADLLAMSTSLDLDIVETSRCWTPLIVACVHDHIDVVKSLLRVGVNLLTSDRRGWSALDHAAYRGHMTIVTLLQQAIGTQSSPNSICIKSHRPTRHPQRKEIQRPTRSSAHPPQPDINSHQTSVFFNFGSFDVHSTNDVFEPPTRRENQGVSQNMQDHLQLEVSADPCQDQPYKIQLPYLGNLSSVTWRFTTTEPDSMRLTFKLFQSSGNSKRCGQLIGSAVVLLKSIKGWFRPGRQSLRRDVTVALNTPDGTFAGSVTFTFLVCGPYINPRTRKPCQTMSSLKRTQVVGHRGLGWNDTGLRRMQIGEHTLQSLQAAIDHGADLIEFDVQITRDRVPVIYHDWYVSESGLDVPIHAMTFSQWMALSDYQTNFHHEIPRGRLPWDERARPSAPPRRTSRSLCGHSDHPRKALTERMKHTVEYSKSHMKGNIRGDCIHDMFVTLRELFEKFPEDVSFDIELKYPMLWECGYWEMEPYWTEMNEYIDTTLDVVFELGGERSIFFTCFNPEVCILLSTKQKTYPVIFLNDSMVSGPAGDKRATSLQQAVRFAHQWGLQGIVMAAEPFVAAPKLIKYVKDQKGLFCGSYGSLNDVPEYAEMQAAEGIDTLIVNNVRLISDTLRSLEY